MDELLQLLRERAASLKDFAAAGGGQTPWTIEANSENVTFVRAATKEVSLDPERAWRAATELRDAILGLGYNLHGECTIGIDSEMGTEGFDGALPIVGWRGYIKLVFETR